MTTKEIVLRELMKAAANGDTSARENSFASGAASAGGEVSASGAANFLSGQELAERCGISRQAVWKAVDALRKEGVQIEAVTNSGYRFVAHGNALSAETITALLPDSLHANVIVYDTIDSTNTEAKRRCAGIANAAPATTSALANESATAKVPAIADASATASSLDGTVIVAGAQTVGRGRLGRSFFSPAGSGLYLSIIYVPEKNITSPAVLTASAAVAVSRAIAETYNADTQIKWVNDIFLNGKKVCGILTEGVTNFETGKIDYAIVGIGINILPGNFPPEIANVATSILQSDKDNAKRNELAANIIKEVLAIYRGGTDAFAQAMQEYRERSFLAGKCVTVSPIIDSEEKKYEAKVLDITDDAKLVVQKIDGTIIQLDSGEISLHSANNIQKN